MTRTDFEALLVGACEAVEGHDDLELLAVAEGMEDAMTEDELRPVTFLPEVAL